MAELEVNRHQNFDLQQWLDILVSIDRPKCTCVVVIKNIQLNMFNTT